MKIYLSVVIPMYNEKENLKRGVLGEIKDYLEKQKFSWEVIISDDGSTDESREMVRNFVQKFPNFKLLENPHGGKPFAIRSGAEKASGEICVFTDMDQSTPISEIEKILPFFKADFDIVIGSRGTVRKDFPWYRRLMSWGFRSLRRFLLLRDLVDTQCGFKAFKTSVGKRIFGRMTIFQRRSKGWKVGAWDVEFLFVAQKLGFKIKEVPIVWVDKDVALGKQRNFVKESREMFSEILRVKLNDWKGKYD